MTIGNYNYDESYLDPDLHLWEDEDEEKDCEDENGDLIWEEFMDYFIIRDDYGEVIEIVEKVQPGCWVSR